MKRRYQIAAGLLAVSSFQVNAATTLDAKSTPIIEASGVRKLVAIPFAETPQIELKLDLHLPPKDGKPTPVLVWIHGGGWMEGTRGFCPIAPLAVKGYAVASISYRFAQQATFPAQIEDAKAAIRWLRAHGSEYNFDTAHIGVCGESSGAQLAALLGTSGGVTALEGNEGNPDVSSRVQAVVDFCGPTDFTAIDTDTSRVWGLLASLDMEKIDGAMQIMSRSYIMRRYLGDDDKEARAASPVTYVSKDSPPFFIVHGDADYLVPLAQSIELRDALKKNGVEAELDVIKGKGHGFGRLSPEMLEQAKVFFDKHLMAQ